MNPLKPLRLRDMGAFHVGGRDIELRGLPRREVVLAEGGQPVPLNPNGHYRVEQMYAQYFLCDPPNGREPLAFWHGGGMTGAAWETTPDGRPGWLNYFLSEGWDAYLCDAVERGRAGYASHIWPDPAIVQTQEDFYTRFRLGPPGSRPGQGAYARQQFPLAAFAQLAAQMVPRWAHTDAAILDGYRAFLRRVGRATVICHSQAGVFGLRLAQEMPQQVRAVVALEPASIPALPPRAEYRTPTLILLGDNMDEDARWPQMRARIEAFAQRHSSVTLWRLPEMGHVGNSHMLMMDGNSLALAEQVRGWLDRR